MLTEDEFTAAYRSADFEVYAACLRVLGHRERAGRPLRRSGKVTLRRAPDAPALSWLCVSDPEETAFTLGPRVEQRGSLFVEGVWDGPFEEWQFRQSFHVFGSGCSYRRNLVFTPPRHGFDALYCATDGTRSIVSNSMAAVFLAARPDRDDAALLALTLAAKDHCIAATTVGVDLADPLVTEQDGWRYFRVMFHDFALAETGEPVRLFHVEAPVPPEFEAYRANLQSVADRLVANARSSARAFPLSVATTVSNGYDSPACSSVAKAAGCEIAHTIGGDVRGRSDSGETVAAELGLAVKVHPHVFDTAETTLSLPVEDEFMPVVAEFLATPGYGDDVVFASFAPDIRNAMVFEGSFGDAIWRKKRAGPGLAAALRTAKSKSEFRLRNGTVFVPLPVVGAKHAETILAIRRGADMEPFTLGVPYDRPIPRRIAEEAGVSRTSFGQRKGATAPSPKNVETKLVAAMRSVMQRYRTMIGEG